MRHDIHDLGALARDYFHLLNGLVNVPERIIGKLGIFDVLITSLVTSQFLASAALALLVTAYFCAALARAMYRAEKAGPSTGVFRPEAPRPAVLPLVGMLFVLASAFLAPFLALDAGGGYWRTQILAGPFASIAIALLLYLFIVYLPRHAGMRSVMPSIGVYSCALFAIAMTGFAANALSHRVYNSEWQQIRVPIERLLETIPSVKSGTIIMLQGVPVGSAPWGSNWWFDILVRLAYPRTQVAGAYSFDLASATPADVKSVVSSGGEVLQLKNGRKFLAPHGGAYVIEGDKAVFEKFYRPTLISAAGIENVVVLEWRNDGQFKIVRNTDEVELAVSPDKDHYDPDARIDPAGLSEIARRRFFQ
jgi:hypothetical protein